MSLRSLLTDLSTSCIAAQEVLPEQNFLAPPENGISLFDVKNDLFLSYIQTLALRNLAVVKCIRAGRDWGEVSELNDALTKSLIRQRVYLEKGVRPLEQRIKYQVDKVVKAANDEETRLAKAKTVSKDARTNGHDNANSDDDEGEEDGEDEDDEDAADEDIDDLAYRPNPAAFARARQEDEIETRTATNTKSDGVYRPPRISATAMPDIDQKERRERKPMRSNTVDDYIASEMSTAPSAQPSVGSTILEGGRRVKNARTIAEEAERREYEETHLVRLPAESKKERARKKARDRTGFGGEDLQGLGANVDRIADLTRKKTKLSSLERSRKRRAVEDGPRGDGVGAGSAFEIKRQRMEKKRKR